MALGCGGRSLLSSADGTAPSIAPATASSMTPAPMTPASMTPASMTPPARPGGATVHGRLAADADLGGISLFSENAAASSQPLLTLHGAWQTPGCSSLSFDSAGNLYALCSQPTSPTGERILVFSPDAKDGDAPMRTITGSKTTLSENATNLTVDAAGNIYVVVDGYCQVKPICGGMVSVFAHGANGNVAPARLIQGSHTGFDDSMAIAVDAAGQIYVGNADGNGTPILVFSSDAHDDASPIRRIGRLGDVQEATAITLDASGALYVAGRQASSFVKIYGPNAAEGDPANRTLAGPATGIDLPGGIAVDGVGRIFVSTEHPSGPATLDIFARDATGDEAPDFELSGVSGGDIAIAP
jgi:sugar lactone lactonase YvrE